MNITRSTHRHGKHRSRDFRATDVLWWFFHVSVGQRAKHQVGIGVIPINKIWVSSRVNADIRALTHIPSRDQGNDIPISHAVLGILQILVPCVVIGYMQIILVINRQGGIAAHIESRIHHLCMPGARAPPGVVEMIPAIHNVRVAE